MDKRSLDSLIYRGYGLQGSGVEAFEVEDPLRSLYQKAADVQRRRDDNKNKICAFEGEGGVGAERKTVQKRCFFFFSWETPRQ